MKPLEEQHTPRKEDRGSPYNARSGLSGRIRPTVRLRIKSTTPIGSVFGFSTFAVVDSTFVANLRRLFTSTIVE